MSLDDFLDAGNVGVGGILDNVEYLLDVPVADITVLPQIRTEFNGIQELAADISVNGLTNPVMLRIADNGYVLCAGERRLRAVKLNGDLTIKARARKMTDQEFLNIQISENVQQSSLEADELAKAVMVDIETAKSNGIKNAIEHVAKQRNLTASWISKLNKFLNRSDESQRLIDNGITSDIATINTVTTIQSIAPEAAKEFVDKVVYDSKEKKSEAEKPESSTNTAPVSNGSIRKQADELLKKTKGKQSEVDLAKEKLQFYFDILDRGNCDFDEVYHGLDQEKRSLVRDILNEFWEQGEQSQKLTKTLQKLATDKLHPVLYSAFLFGLIGKQFDTKEILTSAEFLSAKV